MHWPKKICADILLASSRHWIAICVITERAAFQGPGSTRWHPAILKTGYIKHCSAECCQFRFQEGLGGKQTPPHSKVILALV